MAIRSESDIIDVVAISNGCSIIEDAAKDYTTCANRVNEAAGICTDKALSVEKKSDLTSAIAARNLEELGGAIATIEENVSYFTSQIRNVAQKIYAQQWEELNAYRAEQRRLAAEREAAAAAARQAANSNSSN